MPTALPITGRPVRLAVVDVLVPTPLHGDIVVRVLDAGFHVQVQKPLARSVEDADRMLAAAARTGAMLRVMEDYIFYPPIMTLREIVESGEIGEPVGVHMNIVATGRRGWDVPMSRYQWQFEQARDGRGMLAFDHGWHQLAVATGLLGPVARIFAWLGTTEIAPGILMDDGLPDGFAAATKRALAYLRSEPVMDAQTAREVLVTLLTALDSGAAGHPLDVPH